MGAASPLDPVPALHPSLLHPFRPLILRSLTLIRRTQPVTLSLLLVLVLVLLLALLLVLPLALNLALLLALLLVLLLVHLPLQLLCGNKVLGRSLTVT